MSQHRVLFHALDTDWTLSKLMLALSAVAFVWTGILLAYILKRAGKSRALTDEELSTLGRAPDPNQIRMHWVGAKGGRVEASASIDTLRRAAKRGDWWFFLAWPCMIMSMGTTVGLLFLGLLAHSSESLTPFYVATALGILPFLTIPPFMAWAALYTNIDLDVDDLDESSNPDEA